jgi:mycofactocin precursor
MADATTETAPVEEVPRELVVVASERDDGASAGSLAEADALVEAELLVEDVSIDGMCGVY